MTEPNAEWVWLARIRRPQGRKGELLCDLLTDFPEKFAERKNLWLIGPDAKGHDFSPAGRDQKESGASAPVPRPIELANHWLHKGAIVLHFAGVDSITQAEELAGLIVAIPRSQRATLHEDEIHIADLIGCELIDVARQPAATIGRIENVDRSAGPVPLLIVTGAKGEVLVPFAKSFLRTLDLEHARIEMALPEGLADLNA